MDDKHFRSDHLEIITRLFAVELDWLEMILILASFYNWLIYTEVAYSAYNIVKPDFKGVLPSKWKIDLVLITSCTFYGNCAVVSLLLFVLIVFPFVFITRINLFLARQAERCSGTADEKQPFG